MSKDRRLGRGLAALLGSPVEESFAYSSADGLPGNPVTSSENPGQPGEDLMRLSVYEIDDNPFQPRRDFNEPEIASLSESLKEHDMLQPILVRRVNGRYQLISGERRLRAAIRAGWSTVPARLREADDRLVAELAIVENLQRKDLNPIEKALSFKRYIDQHRCSQEDLAQRLKIDRSTVANLMRLLELPEKITAAVRSGSVSMGHARALLSLDEPEQLALCQKIQAEGLSVRAVEAMVQERMAEEQSASPMIAGKIDARRHKQTSTQIAALEQELKLALGLRVEIRANVRGKGKLTILFDNHDEFERIRATLSSDAPPQADRMLG